MQTVQSIDRAFQILEELASDPGGISELSRRLDLPTSTVARLLATLERLGAVERKTGARGLRSIMESILLDTMYDLPSEEGAEEVMINGEVVEGRAQPLYIYADRQDDVGTGA